AGHNRPPASIRVHPRHPRNPWRKRFSARPRPLAPPSRRHASLGPRLRQPRDHRMAEQDQGADKTEKPTPKKIRDARKEGNVALSKELTGTVLLLGWIALGGMLASHIYGRIAGLFNQSLQAVSEPFHEALPQLGQLAVETLLWTCLPLMGMALALGVVIEFLQVGPVVSIKKITPKMDKMNPVEGIKRMFS